MMNAEQYRRISEAFDDLAQLPVEARPGELLGRFPQEPDLRAEVEALLAEHDRQDAPVGTAIGLEAAAKSLSGHGQGPPVRVVSPEELLPVLKGAYRLLRVIGEGGMGVVYEAEQAFPRRRVALKSIRAGITSASMLRRFKTEIQLLARLDHTGIAQVYEAGYADDRSPDQAFLAMELVEGKPLNRYARTQELSIRERLELFLRVCDAVQHAHQRGVIHRDLKPANILVNQSGQSKVLDFGIARAVDEIEEGTLFTRAGQVVGTPSYMSPEQLRGEPVDTRTDVYSLGVILYELLSDELPFDLSKVPLSEAVKVVLERATPLSKVKANLRGDIETIVSKAMHADRDRRYSSAAALADDVRCYLESRPINARRDSAVYVMRKFAGRHKATVSALAVLLVAIVAFGVFSVVMASKNAKLAHDSDMARLDAVNESVRSAALSRTLEDELSAARIDRGRAEAAVGKFKLAEELLWTEYFTHPNSTQARWGLWELYHRIPCLWTNFGEEAPTAAAVAPDGRHVVMGFSSGRVDVHSGVNGDKLYSYEPLGAAVSALSVSSQNQIAIGLANGRIATVPLGEGNKVRRLDTEPTHVRGTRTLSFSGDGKKLAVGGIDKRVSLWDVASGTRIDTWVVGSELVYSVSLNMDGSEMVTVAGRKPEDRLWWRLTSPPQQKSLLALSSRLVFTAAFLPDGKTLALGFASQDSDVPGYSFGVLDLSTLSMSMHVNGVPSSVIGISAVSGSREVAVRSGQSVLLIDLGNGTSFSRGLSVRSLGQQRGSILSAGMLDDGRVISVSDRAEIRCFSTTPEPAVKYLKGIASWCFAVAWSPDGSRMAVEGGFHVTTYETGTWRKISVANFDRAVRQRGLRFLRDSRTLIMGGLDGRVRRVDSTTGEILATYGPEQAEVYALAMSPDERVIYTGHRDGVIRVWDAASGEIVNQLPKLERRIEALSVSPDGKQLAATGLNKGIAIWDVATWTRGPTLETSYVPWGVAFSPDGSEIAASTHSGSLDVLDAVSGVRRASVVAHQRLVPGLAYSPDGKIIATGSEDGSLKLWDAKSLRQLLTFEGNSAEIVTVGFDPSSRYLAASSAGLAALVYDLRWSDSAIAGNLRYQEALYKTFGAGREEK